jgi:hypothetical protein
MAMQLLRIIGLITLGGCATIFSPSSENITIESEPSGAMVYFENGNEMGKTPLTQAFKRKLSSPSFEIRKAGYESVTIKLDRKLDNLTLIEAIPLVPLYLYFPLLVSADKTTVLAAFLSSSATLGALGTDVLTGNMFEYSTHKYVLELPKKNAKYNPSALELVIKNHQEFKKNLARNEQGELQDSLCHAWELNDTGCAGLWKKAYESRTALLESPDSLAFYRQLKLF